jgi:hypothetical protein
MPSRDAAQPAKPAGSARVCPARHHVRLMSNAGWSNQQKLSPVPNEGVAQWGCARREKLAGAGRSARLARSSPIKEPTRIVQE